MAVPRVAPARLRGREREWESVLGLLDSAAIGRGGIMLVDGAPGIGKTRLLTAAEDSATDHGFSLARARPDEVSQQAPWFAGPESAPRGVLEGRTPVTRTDLDACLEKAAARVGERTAHGPTLITVDDLQCADEATVAAMRALPARLAGQPVGWVLVRRLGAEDPAADRLFEDWQQLGAVRVELGPLPPDVVADVVSDVLRAKPDLDLLSLAKGAAGNPQLLVALLYGLCDEGAVGISGGQARLISGQSPQRVEEVIDGWLERLSPVAQNLLEVAAFLGPSFAVADLAEVLGWPAERLAAPLRDLVACDLLTSVRNDVLTFQHDLVRQSVTHRVPAAVRTALCSQRRRRLSRSPVASTGSRRTAALTSPKQTRAGWDRLTDSERMVAGLVAQGLTNREAAKRLFLSPHTISFHLRKVYRKLGVSSRVELTRLSIEQEQIRAVPSGTVAAAPVAAYASPSSSS
jgi:DNA-binding CsgD family transcriptional regulator